MNDIGKTDISREMSKDGHLYAVYLKSCEEPKMSGKKGEMTTVTYVLVVSPFNSLPNRDEYILKLPTDSAKKIFVQAHRNGSWRKNKKLIDYANLRDGNLDSIAPSILMVRDVQRLSRLESKLFDVKDSFAEAAQIDPDGSTLDVQLNLILNDLSGSTQGDGNLKKAN